MLLRGWSLLLFLWLGWVLDEERKVGKERGYRLIDAPCAFRGESILHR